MESSGNAGVLQRLNLGTVVAGAVVSLLAGVVLDLLLGLATSGSTPGNAAFFADLCGKLVAFLLGGYAAGRIASRWGGLNGVIAALANVLLTYAFSAVAFAVAFVVVLFSVASGSGSVGVAPWFSGEPDPPLRSLLTMLLILAYLVTPFLFGYLGGKLGERHASR